jgi:formylglycine-generating enzyme
MAWVSGGALVAGTPPDELPRIADQEMRGEQVVLHGFYIDVFPYPDEEGAIPVTNVTQSEAAALCEGQGKRLCSELEWERACKGQRNQRYEYGDEYRADRCGTGGVAGLRPSGINVGCRSEFGVRDLHGGVWEWTASSWGRADPRRLIAVRGGNAPAGELVGRCANGVARAPDAKSAAVGFRCCAGEPNPATVTLEVQDGPKLVARAKVDKPIAAQLAGALPDAARTDLGERGDFRAERMWIWRPVGNEELVVMSGCTGIGTRPACGILVARVVLDRARVLGWSTSGHWAPNVQVDVDARDLWLFGGDDLGAFRRLIQYSWGRVEIGAKERRMPRPDKQPKARRGRR